MDGGGRVLEPLTAGFPGGAAARAAPLVAPRPLLPSLAAGLLRFPVRFAGRGLGRRSSVAVPLARRLPRLTGTGLIFGLFIGLGLYGLAASGRFAEFRQAYGDPRDIAARLLGFGLQKVTISGIVSLTEKDVLDIAGIDPRTSLPFLGAAEVRLRLEAAPAIASATVRKLYPHELVVSLVERVPYALWQREGELFVVAADGVVIGRMQEREQAGLPLVVGDGANQQAAAYVALLEAAGPLRSKIRAGMLVSGRRWTLKMENGLDVRLPEDGAVAAVQRLVRLSREQNLLDKDVLAVDLRMPDRIVVRLTEEAAAARTEAAKKKLQRGVKGVET